eukprot:866412-Pleurochrysis_carterae.AAC.2
MSRGANDSTWHWPNNFQMPRVSPSSESCNQSDSPSFSYFLLSMEGVEQPGTEFREGDNQNHNHQFLAR